MKRFEKLSKNGTPTLYFSLGHVLFPSQFCQITPHLCIDHHDSSLLYLEVLKTTTEMRILPTKKLLTIRE